MAKDYTVLAQRQTTDLTPDGRFVDVMEVTAETRTGRSFKVLVPVSSYDPETVDQVLSARAAKILAVDQL